MLECWTSFLSLFVLLSCSHLRLQTWSHLRENLDCFLFRSRSSLSIPPASRSSKMTEIDFSLLGCTQLFVIHAKLYRSQLVISKIGNTFLNINKIVRFCGKFSFKMQFWVCELKTVNFHSRSLLVILFYHAA